MSLPRAQGEPERMVLLSPPTSTGQRAAPTLSHPACLSRSTAARMSPRLQLCGPTYWEVGLCWLCGGCRERPALGRAGAAACLRWAGAGGCSGAGVPSTLSPGFPPREGAGGFTVCLGWLSKAVVFPAKLVRTRSEPYSK